MDLSRVVSSRVVDINPSSTPRCAYPGFESLAPRRAVSRGVGPERREGAALCVPKTSNPTIVVMKSAQDGA